MTDRLQGARDQDTSALGALPAWQARLHVHFEALAAERQVSGWPVFALEHNLSRAEVEAVEADVRSGVRSENSLSDWPLPWVVYAAELGYRYSGDEYWRTFARETPGWQDTNAWRQLVRRAFRRFAGQYHGAEPEGAWARFFNIIAWPITHGILPRDLQRQLAELLYDARLSFRPDVFNSAEALGRHLRSRGARQSARFRQFAENTTLLGQIAAALLLQDEEQDSSHGAELGEPQHPPRLGGTEGTSTAPRLILSSALARIVADLTHERDARDWLDEARRAAARLRFRGLGGLSRREAPQGTASSPGSGEPPLNESSRGPVGLEPSIVLRESGPGRWRVHVEFPNLRRIADLSPHVHEVLTRVQGRVGTAGGPILARGRILAEARPSVVVAAWPAPEDSLLTFEGAPSELRALLDASFRGPAGDSWLFKVAVDGQAYEVKQRTVRPGSSYILLRRTATERPAAGLVKVDVACTGVFGLRIDVSDVVPETLASILEVLGVSIARSLRVWPAGLPVPAWSGEGIAEWLAGDPIVLGIQGDSPMAWMSLAVNGDKPFRLPVAELSAGKPLFVTFGQLPEGRHRILITACSWSPLIPSVSRAATASTGHQDPSSAECAVPPTGGYSEGADATGVLDLIVRAPRSVEASAGARGTMSFAIHPDPPTLEDLWEGRCELHLAGSGTPTVRCHVALFERSKPIAIWARRLPALALPLDTAAWRATFSRHVRKHVQDHYDAAHRCQVDFDAGALGWVRVNAERDFTPLRWAVQEAGRRVVLIDSQGAEAPEIRRFDCHTPDVGNVIAPSEAERGVQVEQSGALFTARSNGAVASIVVVPPFRGALADLGIEVRVNSRSLTASDLRLLVEDAQLWETARLSANPLAETRRVHAVAALLSELFGRLGGERWASAENVIQSAADFARGAALMKPLVSDRRPEQGIAAALVSRAGELADAAPEARALAFGHILRSFLRDASRALEEEQLAEFALRLASSASATLRWLTGRTERLAGIDQGSDRLKRLLHSLIANPLIARAARYCVIAIAAELHQRHPDIGSLSEAWRWQ